MGQAIKSIPFEGKVKNINENSKIKKGDLIVSKKVKYKILKNQNKISGLIIDKAGTTNHLLIFLKNKNIPIIINAKSEKGKFPSEILKTGDQIKINKNTIKKIKEE